MPLFLVVWLFSLYAHAGELSRAEIEQRFQDRVAHEGLASASGSGIQVGDKLQDIPAWPLLDNLSPDTGPVGYVFETIDLAPIPGFEGTPINLLVEIDAQGNFKSVEVLRQHEPVFVSGLGPGPLNDFVKQYEGKNIAQEITISSGFGHAPRLSDGANRVVVDGVAKATASIRIVNQSVLGGALAIARSKLGFSGKGEHAPPARVRQMPFEKLDFQALMERGYVQRISIDNARAESLFSGTEGAGLDDGATGNPKQLFVELYVAYLNAPIIGRNLLGDASWSGLMSSLQDDRPAFWVATRGRYSIIDDGFVPGSVVQRLELVQDGLPMELRDANLDYARVPAIPDLNASLIMVGAPHTGLDPGREADFSVTLSRTHGMIFPVVTKKQITLHYLPSVKLFQYPPRPLPEWLQAWEGRVADLGIIGLALLLLTGALLWPRPFSRNPRILFWFRVGFLCFTLAFIGWHAQGQLSIVQITGATRTLINKSGLEGFLYDPVSLLLIVYTLISLVIWGRSAYCGWLCPFGALQEFVGLSARALGVPQWELSSPFFKHLERGRYVLLAMLMAGAVWTSSMLDRVVEIEPFKTAITLGFRREARFLVWAVGLLVAGAFIYKFFCRFLCPLGAALTLGGRLRLWNWLPRIDACGQPCQKCRKACLYDAIEPDGRIDYDNCFQCLDCVGIYHDAKRCSPRLLYATKGKTITIRSSRH